MNIENKRSFGQVLWKIWKENRIFFGVLSLLVVILTGLIVIYEPLEILFWLNTYREGRWIEIFQLITLFGEPISYIIACFLLMFYKYRYAILVPISGLLTLFFTFVLKTSFKHPRPMLVVKNSELADMFQVMEGISVYEGTTSFPSGHTFAAFTLFTLLALMFSHKVWVEMIFVLIAALVGLSRMFLMHHFAHDVLFGLVLGTILGVLLFALDEIYLKPKGFWDKNLWYSIHRKNPLDSTG